MSTTAVSQGTGPVAPVASGVTPPAPVASASAVSPPRVTPACDFGQFSIDPEKEVSFAAIAYRQKYFDGKKVLTRGFILLDFETHRLVPTRWDLRIDPANIVTYEVRILGPLADERYLQRACGRRDVMVEGTFVNKAREDGSFPRWIAGEFFLTAIKELPPETFRIPSD
ncbi:MAG: hypothetical protein EOO70_06580 [Myxococcaceae bacterium]|nr:MAG: hypothetical protein EOO70_06580 [Myxococcaceae bacterium]